MKAHGSEFVLFCVFILQRSIIYLLSGKKKRALAALIFECLHSVCELLLPYRSPVCSPAMLLWQGSYAVLSECMAWKALSVNKCCCYSRKQGRRAIINKPVVYWDWALCWCRLLIGSNSTTTTTLPPR